jgi:uncharacterized membrane protein (DUF2068 family)
MSGNLISPKLAAYPVLLSALLHLFAFIPDGLNAGSGILFGIGIIYVLLAMGLRRNKRWVAWLAFLAMTFGAVVAYMLTGSGTSLHDGWFLVICIFDVVAALILFVCLWRSQTQIMNSQV